MKLYYALPSPFARKCLVCAHELGLRDRIELVPVVPHPVTRDAALVAVNPLGKIPALVTAQGSVLYDSRVICEYLNAEGDGRLLPPPGPARWSILTEQALADGLMDAAVLTRYETAVRPEDLRWNEWIGGQLEKVTCALADIERRADEFAHRMDLGVIAMACALGYLDLRFASLEWALKFPRTASWYGLFCQRPSMLATRPG